MRRRRARRELCEAESVKAEGRSLPRDVSDKIVRGASRGSDDEQFAVWGETIDEAARVAEACAG
jgi:hypothetical protein